MRLISMARFAVLALTAAATTVGVVPIAALPAAAAGMPPGAHQVVPAAVRSRPALNDVACTSAKNCFAVGMTWAGSQGSRPVVQRWRGGKWSPVTVRLPAGATGGTLASVSCPAANRCLAVGYVTAKGSSRPLAETWNGRTWRADTPPTGAAGHSGLPLDAVSCASARSCVAVGTSDGTAPVSVAEMWNGRKFTAVTLPKPAKKNSVFIVGVSCPELRHCVAVGSYSAGNTGGGWLSETWNGRAWKAAKRSPVLGYVSLLTGISCVTATRCVAVGQRQTHSGFRVYADQLHGTRWTVTRLAAHKGDDHLAGVSCASASSCLTVGASGGEWPYINTGVAYAESWNGKAWTVRKVPAAPGSGKPAAEKGSQLSGVMCLRATYCMAVGEAGAKEQGFSAAWNGRAWKLARAA